MFLQLSDIDQNLLIHRMSFLDLSHPFNVLYGCVYLSAVLMLLQHHVIKLLELIIGQLRYYMLNFRSLGFLLIRRWYRGVLTGALDCVLIILHESPSLHTFEF